MQRFTRRGGAGGAGADDHWSPAISVKWAIFAGGTPQAAGIRPYGRISPTPRRKNLRKSSCILGIFVLY